MRTIICLLVLALSPWAQAIEYREELAPPNVDFYLELQATRTDFGDLGGDASDGFRIRLGMDLKDATMGKWMWRAEAGLNQFGESSATSSTTRDLDPSEPGYPGTTTTETTTDLRLSGIEAGLRIYNAGVFYLRGGVFLYSLKSSNDSTTTVTPDSGGQLISNPPSNEESFSSISPYMGAGFEIPLVESVKAIAEFNAYQVEDEILDNLSLGFRFEF